MFQINALSEVEVNEANKPTEYWRINFVKCDHNGWAINVNKSLCSSWCLQSLMMSFPELNKNKTPPPLQLYACTPRQNWVLDPELQFLSMCSELMQFQIVKRYYHATLSPWRNGGEMQIVRGVFLLSLKKRGSVGSFLSPYAQPAQLRPAGATSALQDCRGSWHNSPKSQMTQKPK